MVQVYPHRDDTSYKDMTCYDLLQVPMDANDEDIRRGYRLAAKRHHPDTNPYDRAAPARWRAVQQAYDTLRHPSSRARYDHDLKLKQWRASYQNRSETAAVTDVFSSVRRNLERLMRLMAQERDIHVSNKDR